MRLTERDLQIILWINSHRAATAEQVHKKFGMSIQSAKKRLYELKSTDYLIYEKIFHEKPGIYRISPKGIAVTNDDLPPVRIRLGSYEHDQQLVDLAIILEQKTDAVWRTDRQIRHDLGLKGVGIKGHSPDGILEFSSGERTAVELELSSKGKGRIEKILKEYAGSQYRAVWYFVNNHALAGKILSAGIHLIRVFSWPEMKELKINEKTIPPAVSSEISAANPEQKTIDFFRRK